jgi:superfamily II DNA or RNA helicase
MPKSIKAYIGREGYIIEKSSIALDELAHLKEELLITPTVLEEFSKDLKPYPIYHENEKTISIPRYYGKKEFGDVPKKFTSTNVTFEFTKQLRPQQMEVIDDVLPKIVSHGGGIISLPCGAGKTVISLYLAHKLGLKTLVLVHKSFLQSQWVERANTFTNAKIGTIRGPIIDVDNKDIVIGMIQSISMKEYDSKVFDGFGLVIVDECHHIASRVFSKALYKTATQYTIGLSATPKRADGLTKIIHWYLGKMIFQQERKCDNNIVVRKLNLFLDDPLFQEKTVYAKGKSRPNAPKMITNFCNIERRNQIILRIIDTLRQNPKRKILVLSGRIAHLEFLKTQTEERIQKDIKNGKLLENECQAHYYIGKMKQAERKQAELYGDILFASYEMAHEGLDIDRLNTVILATPKKSVVQAIGRIMRRTLTANDLKPLIVDITDDISVFTNQGKVRHNLYKKNKYNIQEFMVDDKYQVPINDYKKDDKNTNKKNHKKITEIFNEEGIDKSINDKCFKSEDKKTVVNADTFNECLFDD